MTQAPSIKWKFCAQTDVGLVRKGNEDNFLVLDLSTNRHWTAHDTEATGLQTFEQGRLGALFAVSDGMGGALAGEVASRMAVELVRARMLEMQDENGGEDVPLAERLRAAIEEANADIYDESLANAECRGMGATFTGVALDHDVAYFAQIGDSRAHVIRDGFLRRITKDQSLVQQLIDAGQITEEEAETHGYRNYILQALGPTPGVTVEMNRLRLQPGDILLLCSDGLSGKLREPEMLEIVMGAGDLQAACAGLICGANERGGEDNITVVLAQFVGEAAAEPEGEIPEPEIVARAPDTDELDVEPLPAAARIAAQSVAPAADTLDDTFGLSPVTVHVPAYSGVPSTGVESFGGSLAPQENGSAGASFIEGPVRSSSMPANTSQPEKRVSGRVFAVVFMSTLIVLSALAVYFYRQLGPKRAASQQVELTRLQGRIGELRARIEALRRRAPEGAQPADVNDKLNRLSEQLNSVSSLPPPRVAEVGQACQSVERQVIELERTLGAPPAQASPRATRSAGKSPSL